MSDSKPEGTEGGGGTGGRGRSDGLPEAIGRYKILRELGRGAMGVVYEAEDPKIGRRVALKVLHEVPGLGEAELEEFKSRFFMEARTAGMLSHPNIVVIHDVDSDEALGITFMAMEFLKGRAVYDLLREGVVFPRDKAVDICVQVAEALDHAHGQGIVHRDVKPANLMMLDDGTVKITDFGIAKLSTSNLTRTGQFLGTPNYMSPEQVVGHAIDGRSDLFSLGIILYELLTGEKPFTGSSLTTITYQIVNVNPIEPSKIQPALPRVYDAICSKLLQKSAEDRFQTGKELADALRAALAGGAVSAAPTMETAAPTDADATQVSAPGPGVTPPTPAFTTPSAGVATHVAAAPAQPRGRGGLIAATAVLGAALITVLAVLAFQGGFGAASPAAPASQPGDASSTLASAAPPPATATRETGTAQPPPAQPAGDERPSPGALVAAVGGPSAGAAAGQAPEFGETPPDETAPGGAAPGQGATEGRDASSAADEPSGAPGGGEEATPPPARPEPVEATPAAQPEASRREPETLPPRESAPPRDRRPLVLSGSTIVDPAGGGGPAAAGPASAPALAPAPVSLVIEHKIRQGTVTIDVDGEQVFSMPIAKQGRGKTTQTASFEIPEGRHEVEACVRSSEIRDGGEVCSRQGHAFVRNRDVTFRLEHVHFRLGGGHKLAFQIE